MRPILACWAILSLVGFSMDARSETLPTSVSGTPILNQPGYGPLKLVWQEIQGAFQREDWETAISKLHHLKKVRAELGLSDLYPISSALLHASKRATSDDAEGPTKALAEAASQLSPHRVASHWGKADLLLSSNLLEIVPGWEGWREGFAALQDDQTGRLAVAGNALTLFMLVTLIWSLLFATGMLLRYAWTAANDLKRLSMRTLDTFQARLLLLPILALPLLLGLGLMTTLILVILCTALYQSRREKLVSIWLLVSLGLSPLTSERVLYSHHAQGTLEATMNRCLESLCSSADRKNLTSATHNTPTQHAAFYTLAVLAARQAAVARTSFKEAETLVGKSLAASDTWQARTLQGNIAYMSALHSCKTLKSRRPARAKAKAKAHYKEEREAAAGYYELAIKANKNAVEPLYNAGVMTRQDRVEGESRLAQARTLARDRVRDWETRVSEGHTTKKCGLWGQANRHVMVPGFPPHPSGTYKAPSGSNVSAIALPFSELLTGRSGFKLLPILGLGGAGLAFLLLFLGSAAPVSRRCRRCPSVADPKTGFALDAGAMCETCVLADASRGRQDAKAAWVRERRVEEQLLRRMRIRQFTSWLLPGVSAFWRGWPFRGSYTVVMMSSTLIMAFNLQHVIPLPGELAETSELNMIFFSSIAGLIFLFSIIRAHRAGGRP